MFRKGGLSQETGIMSGLDSPRRSYAGGGNIGGGSISGNLMGSRMGFKTPYVEGYNRINWNPTASTTSTTGTTANFMERLGYDHLQPMQNVEQYKMYPKMHWSIRGVEQ